MILIYLAERGGKDREKFSNEAILACASSIILYISKKHQKQRSKIRVIQL